MSRILIVGCGCRGRELAGSLLGSGHVVRGTTRREESRAAIEAAGAEAVVADPDLLSTLVPHLDGVSALCWLMASASGESEAVAALHGSRLESIAAALVDTHVRGLVYEAAGTLAPELLAEGAATARRVGDANRMPVEVLDHDPTEASEWTSAAHAAVERVLSA